MGQHVGNTIGWDIEYLNAEQVVRATTRGTITREVALTVAADLASNLRRQGARKFLVDHRAAVLNIGIIDLYYLADETREVGLGADFVGALVFPVDTDHASGFYEIRTANVGLLRKAFTDYDAALAWLAAS